MAPTKCLLSACLHACFLACLPACLLACMLAYLPTYLPACLLPYPKTPIDSLECCRNSFRAILSALVQNITHAHTDAQHLDTLGSYRSQKCCLLEKTLLNFFRIDNISEIWPSIGVPLILNPVFFLI